MIVGAALLIAGNPTVTGKGLAIGLMLSLTMAFSRLTQRAFVGSGEFVPISALACVSGFITAIGNGAIAWGEGEQVWYSLPEWISDPSTILMFVLSVVSVTLQLVSALCWFRKGTATALLSYNCVANVIAFLFSVAWFGDTFLTQLRPIVGVLVTLVAALWYAVEVVLCEGQVIDAKALEDGSDGETAKNPPPQGGSALLLISKVESPSNQDPRLPPRDVLNRHRSPNDLAVQQTVPQSVMTAAWDSDDSTTTSDALTTTSEMQ